VEPGKLIQDFSRHARVATAVLPLLAAWAVRVFAGKSRTASWLITAAAVWLVINILVAPYSAGMRQDLHNLSRLLP
jgi:hypothetical protein